MRSLLGKVILVVDFSPSSLSISCHSLLVCKVSAEVYADSLMAVPLYVTSYFSIPGFKILSMSLIFDSVVVVCLGLGVLASSCL